MDALAVAKLFVFVGGAYSVILHEVAHALSAYWCGDDTAYRLGRISLSPVTHIHPVGTVLVPLLLVFSGSGVFFGWANPVPVNPLRFRNRVRDDIIVSMAGIVVNLLIAFLLLIILVLLMRLEISGPSQVLIWVARLNVFLAVFNLLPLPPLDGSHVMKYLLPREWRAGYEQIGFSGVFILLALLWFTRLGDDLVDVASGITKGMIHAASGFWSLFGL